MNGLQLINLLTGQQPGQANGVDLSGIFGNGSGNGSGNGTGDGLFQATLGGLLTSAAADAGTLVPGVGLALGQGQGKALGVGLLNPDGEASALLAAQSAAGDQFIGQIGEQVVTAGQGVTAEGVPVAAGTAKSTQSDGTDVVAGVGAEVAVADEMPELQIFRADEESLLAHSGASPDLFDLSQTGTESGNPFLSGAPGATPAELLAASKAAAGDKITGIGLDQAGRASKAAALLHASPTAVTAILASAANGKNPVFTADATATTTDGEASTSPASATPLVAPIAAADVSAARQAAAQKGSGAGQENSSGKEAGAQTGGETGANTGSDAGSDKGAGFGPGGQGSAHGGGIGGGNGRKAGGTLTSVQLANADHASNPASNIGINAPGQKIAEAAIAMDRGPQAGMFAPLDSGVSNDPFFGFQTSSSASASNVGLGVAQPGGVSLASATGASQPGATPSFVPTHHAASAQVGLQVTRAVVNGDSEFTVRLNPKELGRVEARLEFSADRGVRAYFVAESRETLALLQKDSHVLERALADAGIDTDSASLNFSLRQNGEGFADGSFGGEGSFGERGLAGDEMSDVPDVDVTDQIVRHVISDSAVDITI